MNAAILQRIGFWPKVLSITGASMVMSLSLTCLVMALTQTDRHTFVIGCLISLLIPLIVAPIVSVSLLVTLSKLEEARTELDRLAHFDELTGAYNRRFFFKNAQEWLGAPRALSAPYAVLVFDIDHFKRINDRYGHNGGDTVLVGIGQRCQQFGRHGDVFARFGGEEFCFMLRDCNADGALRFAERLRLEIERARFPYDSHDINCTVSVGVASGFTGLGGVEAVIQSADTALYRAKSGGRNRVCVHADAIAVER